MKEGQEIIYRTKEASNNAQREAFLALDPLERLYRYLQMIKSNIRLYGETPPNPNNLILERKNESSLGN